jgi:hypothetical protein
MREAIVAGVEGRFKQFFSCSRFLNPAAWESSENGPPGWGRLVIGTVARAAQQKKAHDFLRLARQ